MREGEGEWGEEKEKNVGVLTVWLGRRWRWMIYHGLVGRR